jgi:integrase
MLNSTNMSMNLSVSPMLLLNEKRTKQVYLHQLIEIISPKWGGHRLKDVKPIAVENWLNGLPGAPGSRAKTKGVMSVLFQHAMRYKWMTRNPFASSVRAPFL